MGSSLAQSDRVGSFNKTLIRNMEGLALVGRNVSGTGDGGAIKTSTYTFNALAKATSGAWLDYLTVPTGGATNTLLKKSSSTDYDWAWGLAAFLELSDTPSSYSGQSGKTVVVSSSENALVFTSVSLTNTFTALSDTPTSYSGQADKLVAVSSSENALVFTSVSTGLTHPQVMSRVSMGF